MTSISAALVTQNCIAGAFERNLSYTLEMTENAAEQGAQIIVFPEMNLTGYLTGKEIMSISRSITDETTVPLRHLASKLNMVVLAGLAERTGDSRVYATHLVFFPDGSYQCYRKTHTAPFEKRYFSAGNRIPVFSANNLCFGVQLCYDAHFPELSLTMSLKGVDIIFIPHASPRGTSQEKYHSWLRHLTARAFDNGIFIAACNQTGDNDSGLSFPGLCLLIGPDGNVISRRVKAAPGMHMVDIDLSSIERIRSHKMRYFLPNRRNDLFQF